MTPKLPATLLPRLFADSVLPCACAAVVLAGVLTMTMLRGADDMAHTRIASQLEQIAGELEHDDGDGAQHVIDEAVRGEQADAPQRVEVEQVDGRLLQAGVPADTSLERYRRELADTGRYRAVVVHVDPRPRQQARQRILVYGALSELAIGLLALLAVFSLRRRVSLPLQRLQRRMDRVLDGDVEVAPPPTEPQRELADLQASVTSLAGLLAAHREEWATLQQASASDAMDRLRQTQAATRSKSQFMALVGHHFRQPMQALQLLTASLHPGVDEEQQAALRQVRESVATMTRLLDALLEISRLDAGVITATSGQFSVADLFLRHRATLLESARQQRVSVIWRRSWHRLYGDIELASSLLHQLASNAIMHAGPQGRVLIAARRVNGGVRIEVRDSGPGIAAIHQQRIFEEFVQLQGEGERREGYGLGLTIAARLAKILGTQIGLRSAPGRGSTFWFELRRAPTVELAGPRHRFEAPVMHHIG